ncbi:MliC family protein [Pseudomonas sp. ABC1]|uniref:MliC family protein n=1 Tax=Pseudomonas sp. ABC1 TaxID=2748080 RepID=UPI0015C2CCF8|nr:MliC family protein [Pseudomonas sp. ABC1]QLF93965.1 MliC family protein [Pseudomonas sp. ABC1]
MLRSLPLLALALLSGCAHWQSGPDAPFVHWKCQSADDIHWRYADAQKRQVDLKIGTAGQAYRLRLEPSLQGRFYSDGVIAFHDKRDGSLVYRLADDRLLAHGCSASLINL